MGVLVAFVGAAVGADVGAAVGRVVGAAVGTALGDRVGAAVTKVHSCPTYKSAQPPLHQYPAAQAQVYASLPPASL